MSASNVALLFDLDGTLTDPAEGLLKCIRHALERLEVACPTDAELHACIGPPLHESFARLLGDDGTARVAHAMRHFRERFTDAGIFENRLYEGIEEALAALREAGTPLVVATSKPQPFAERILRHFDLAQYFDGVYGSELDGTRSNKGELIAHLLAREALRAEDAVMIGDRAHDVIGAKANGVRSIGVLWGYGSREELVSAGADALCDAPEKLVGAVSSMRS